MSTPIVKSGVAVVAQTPKGTPAWRAALALALALGVAMVVAAATAAAVASGSLDDGEHGGWQSSAAPFLGQRQLRAAGRNEKKIEGAPCLTAAEGELCHRLVQWAMEDGLRLHPERYAGLTRNSSFEDFQLAVHRSTPDYCPRPCAREQPALAAEEGAARTPAQRGGLPAERNSSVGVLGGCDYGHSDQRPAHAGCFISRGGKMLAIRLTYDGNRYDIPGGQTSWDEPARCTAHREALEETGYRAAPRELLAVVRNGFHIYRCHLVEDGPVRQHDHEVSWVGWMGQDEVRARVSQGEWRFPEAHRYADWLQ